ncbi:MAG: alpha-L-fucosidase [bacterium]
MRKKVLALIVIVLFSPTFGQEVENTEKEDDFIQWFNDARLGIFIHWGIYAVNGIDESWSFFNGYISYNDYMRQLDGFTASNYDPEEWAAKIRESGARYAVLTAKHHDGVALWPSAQSDLNAVERTPAARDLIGPYVRALRKYGIKVGLYFSHLDWSFPDYPRKTREEYRYREDPGRWRSFLDFRFRQVKELVMNYNPDLLWFDGDWEEKPEMWESRALRDSIKKWKPEIIINARINGFGDYATPEQGLPVMKPEASYWELCMTMNDSWGYQPNDTHYKSTDEILRIFADVIAKGGNLLLDIGPREDGTIPDEQQKILSELGRWTEKHAQAIYGTGSGLPPGYFYGPSTLSVDSTILYLFLPVSGKGPYELMGVKNEIQRIWIVGEGTRLDHRLYGKVYWSDYPGTVFFDLPESAADENMTVVALLLDGKLDLLQTNQ